MSTVVIASAAYIEPELMVEFGRIPPSFLPVGNKRLYSHQHKILKENFTKIILSLPADFIPNEHDLSLIKELGIEIVQVPAGLSLGNSLVYVLNLSGTGVGQVAILHGDTLLNDIEFDETDVVSLGKVPSNYKWGRVDHDNMLIKQVFSADSDEVIDCGQPKAEDHLALSGWFHFQCATLLIQCIIKSNGDFINALNLYLDQRKTCGIFSEIWLDFGHSVTYHQSRRQMTTERSFNKLDSTIRTVTKTGTNNRKIEAEGKWFEAIPPKIRYFTPAFLGYEHHNNDWQYSIEYIHNPTLSDLFVFGQLPRSRWGQIFSACAEFLDACSNIRPFDTGLFSTERLYLEKTLQRLEIFAKEGNISLSQQCKLNEKNLPSLESIARAAASNIRKVPPDCINLVHGDFCFSNILYDFRSELVKVIDPRGIDLDNNITIFGDKRYDVAKLHHSVIGRYDHIIAGFYNLHRSSSLTFDLQLPSSKQIFDAEDEFSIRKFSGFYGNSSEIKSISILLFLSMLPLHADRADRQHAFLANAMRLYLDL